MPTPRRSYLWNYFTILSEREKIALCLSCRQSFSYKSTVTNMKKHLERLHPELLGLPKGKEGLEVEMEVNDWGEPSKKPKKGRPARSKLWQYFKRVEPKHARCEACSQLMAYHGSTTSNLRKHLERKHSQLLLQLNEEERQTSPVAQETVIEDYYAAVPDDVIDSEQANQMGQPMEEVFLDNEDIFKPESASTQTNKQKNKEFKKKHKRRKSTYYSSDDEPIKPKAKNCEEAPDESIDIFGKYITSLLKKLPQSVANRLQIEFVTRIINAKMEIEKTNNQNIQNHASQIITHHSPNLLHQNSDLLTQNTPLLSQNGAVGVLQNGAILAQESMGPDQPKYLITVTTQDTPCGFQTP